MENKLKTAIPYSFLYEHLEGQRKKDRYIYKKPKEILFCGMVNSGKSSLINSVYSNRKLCRVSNKQGSTRNLNYFELKNKMLNIVDAPGYGTDKKEAKINKKIFKFISQYVKQSTRLCKIFWVLDLENGIGRNDHKFIQNMKGNKVALELIFSKADCVDEDEVMFRAFALCHELKRYNKYLSPICHVTSTKMGFGIESIQAATIQAFEEAPTRKVVHKEGRYYYMLEDEDGIPSREEQSMYRALIRQERRELADKTVTPEPFFKLGEE